MKKYSQGGYTGNTGIENLGRVHDYGYGISKETAEKLKPAGVVCHSVSVQLKGEATSERIRKVMRNINGMV